MNSSEKLQTEVVTDNSEQIMAEAMQLQEQLVTWRRELHQMPEVGIKLPRTIEFLRKVSGRNGNKLRSV